MFRIALPVLCLLAGTTARAEPGSIEVSHAWTPALAAKGPDSPLFMTITSHAEAPDALLRVRCPVADFTEKHITDYGEGAPSLREVKTIPVPPGQSVILAPGGYHVMLLHTRQALIAGQSFPCTLAFQNAGSLEIEVRVAPEGARTPP